LVKGVADRGDTTLLPGPLAGWERHAEHFSNAFYCAEQKRCYFGSSRRCKAQPRKYA
jgi:hypothetical protein